jgi:hypothetical protein
MFGSKKSKTVIGAIALLLLISFTPSAVAGRNVVPSLNGTLCKSWGASWNAKNRVCYVGTTINIGYDLIIDAKSTLYITNGTLQFTGANLNNLGTITNLEGNFYNYGFIRNSGRIFNGSYFNSNNNVQNYGYIENTANWDGCVIDSGGSSLNINYC